jgi:hypothetical protein
MSKTFRILHEDCPSGPASPRRGGGLAPRSRMVTTSSRRSRAIAATVLAAFAACSHAAPTKDPGLSPREQEILRRYARDTWHSLEAMIVPGGLPADALHRDYQAKVNDGPFEVQVAGRPSSGATGRDWIRSARASTAA